MTDYIDRQTAIDKINERQRKLIYCFGFENDMVRIMDIARSIIIAMPSIDVIEVVRCKDCKYQDKGQNEVESWNVCTYRPWLYVNTYDDHFCSDGERKNG